MILEEDQYNFQQQYSVLQLSISPSTILATFLYMQDIYESPRLIFPNDLLHYR